MNTIITIFVRHAADCKYEGDEFAKRCNCRKHLRWSHGGKQHRRKAGTRSWEEAENIKRRLEDELAGRKPATREGGKPLSEAVTVFLQDKRNQGVTPTVIGKYTRELERLQDFCWRSGVFATQSITRELLTGYAATWEDAYPSTLTRSKVRERLNSFLRYCYDNQWLDRIPKTSKIQVDAVPTMPLTAKEYDKLLDTCFVTFAEDPTKRDRVHALVQLMRWTGLAIRDALTLERKEVLHDKGKRLYRVVTSRQKTGTHVSVPIPENVAEEVLTVLNGNKRYVFWSGNGTEETVTKNWHKIIRTLFEDAGLYTDEHMVSHRLRDTFAVDLLQKGVPLEEVSKLLGHESIRTTERSYAKWVKGRQDRLDKLVIGTWK